MKNAIIPLASLFIIVSILGTSSCNKNNETELTPINASSANPETFTSLNSFINSRNPSPQYFQVNTSSGGSFTTSNGSTITVPPNAFINNNGQLISGIVELKMKEVFSTSDIMFSGVFPVSYGNVLNSGGEFFIEASQNGEVLLVKNGIVIEVEIPAQAVDNQMQLFIAGPEMENDSLNWVVLDSAVAPGSISSFTYSSADNSYTVSIDTLGWNNIDAFANITYFDISINLTGAVGLNSTNTTSFAKFKNQNSVWPMGKPFLGTISNNEIIENHLGAVPMNVIVISVVDNQLYYGLLDITPQQGQQYSINLIEVLSGELDIIIQNLP